MSAVRPRLLVATFNPGKARELKRLLSPLGVEVLSPAELGIGDAHEETGRTYEENAAAKARHYAALARMPALADDSGLEVDALGGRPGPLSARYGGPVLDDEGRNRLLLLELEGVPDERRTARYVAVVALARPEPAAPGAAREASAPGAPTRPSAASRGLLFRATCEGRIARAPRGAQGFGYDPIFFYPPLNATFGEIDPAEKDRLSHRGQATRQAIDFLAIPAGRAFLEP